MKHYSLVPKLVVGSALLAGCGSNATVTSKDVASAAIYQIYSGNYDAGSKALDLSAQFRVGNVTGTTVKLADGNAIQLDGQPLQLVDGDKATVNVDGTYYMAATTAESAASTYTFHWTQDDGKAFDNTLTMAEPVKLASTFVSTIRLGQDLTVAFDGAAVGNGETVTFTLHSATAGNDTEAACSTTYANSCVITSAAIDAFAPGPAQMTLSRTLTLDKTPMNGGSGSGSLRSVYQSAPVAVAISQGVGGVK